MPAAAAGAADGGVSSPQAEGPTPPSIATTSRARGRLQVSWEAVGGCAASLGWPPCEATGVHSAPTRLRALLHARAAGANQLWLNWARFYKAWVARRAALWQLAAGAGYGHAAQALGQLQGSEPGARVPRQPWEVHYIPC